MDCTIQFTFYVIIAVIHITIAVGSVVEWLSAVIAIDMVEVQNLLAPFCCVLGKTKNASMQYLAFLQSEKKKGINKNK